MTFEMVRIGWPNTAAIVALALMPILSLSTASDWRPAAAPSQLAETATACPASSPAGGMLVAALVAGDTVLE